MTSPYLPAVPLEELRRRRIHEVLRDYPEVLELFRGKGIDPASSGARTLEEIEALAPEDLQDLVRAVAWRGGS